MSDKNKNRKTRLAEFFRYHRDELSGEERHSFERELQKDPFTEEASDGYRSVLSSSSDEDYSDLRKRLKVRSSGRKSFILYRIAASVAIVVAVSSIFIVIEKSRTSKEIAINTFQPPILEISKSKPIIGSANTVTTKKQSSDLKRKSEKPQTKTASPASGLDQEPSKINSAPVKSENNKVNSESAEQQKNDNLADVNSQAVVSEIAEDRISAPAGAVARERSLKKSDKDENISLYIPPQPVIGKADFEKYIKENIRRPDTLSTEKTEVVTISFIVKIDGSLERIRIISSPGKLYSDEAIRLIKSGPAWKPAEQSGKPVKDRVKVKILFR